MSLDETYDRVLLGIPRERQAYAQWFFKCLAESIRPLRADELAGALAIQIGEGEFPNYNVNRRPENPEEAILSACSSLVTIIDVDSSRVVQFSHFSVKEYLTSERLAKAKKPLSLYHIHPHSAHTTLAQASLGVLLALDDQVDKETIKNFPFAIYAARYWVDHAQFDDVCSSIKLPMEQLFDPAKPHFAAWLWLYNIDEPFTLPMATVHPTRPYAVPLYYAALCGFYGVAEDLIDANLQDIDARGGMSATPLLAALERGHLAVAILLIARGADINCRDSQSRTPLHIASRRGYDDLVSLLIHRGVDLNSEEDSRETPLHVAVAGGYDNIVRLLLDHGADADHLDHGGWAPLHIASQEGHSNIVELLLDHGVDANRPDMGGWTPLHLASWGGHGYIVRLLFDQGVDANHLDNSGWTPLHLASWEGHGYIIRLLFDQGVDANHPDNSGWTPLHLVFWEGLRLQLLYYTIYIWLFCIHILY